jgi:hypothetical protein
MTERIDVLRWLERWYQERCDNEWEQEHGIQIQTIDNPGWLVSADLRGMNPETTTDRVLAVIGDPPSAKNGNCGGDTWMTCEVKSGRFVGAGDPSQLRAILAQFRKLVEDEGA